MLEYSNNKPVTISVIIPTFNAGKTIQKALGSILSQTFSDYEIILVDGMSSDNTLSIIKEQAQKEQRIRWISEKDKGIYDAMNKGIKMAKGNWLLFLGSDDYLYSTNTLNNVNAIIEKNPKAKFIYGDVFTSAMYVQKYKDYTYTQLLSTNICHQSIFYSHELFQNKRYNVKYKIFADWDFNLKVFRKKNQPLYLNEIVANFNLMGTSGDWHNTEEYIKYFSNPKKMMIKYRGLFYLLNFYFHKFLHRYKVKSAI